MGIWIRSQDKKVLVKVQKVYIYDNQICNKGKVLGRHLTPMRTLEVLDEIQNRTILNQCMPPEHRFYEMPKE